MNRIGLGVCRQVMQCIIISMKWELQQNILHMIFELIIYQNYVLFYP